MLNIYVGKSNKPANCIDDVESAFYGVRLRDDAFTESVLSNLEKAKSFDADNFVDRFGRSLYNDNLSTGSKILLETHYYVDRVYNGNELGYNGVPFLLKLSAGNIYFDTFNVKIPDFPEGWLVCLNGNVVINSSEFMEVVDEI